MLAVTNNDHEKQARQQNRINGDKLKELERQEAEEKLKIKKKKKLKKDLENYQKLVQQEMNLTKQK